MSKYLEMPWSVEDTIENLKEVKEVVQTICRNMNSDGKGEKDAEEVAFDFDRAIKALEEIQQYRAIGTVAQIKEQTAELERWHTDHINKNIKNPFAWTSTLVCHNCDHKDDYIEELEAEIEEYRAIGTVEECRTAEEKQKGKPCCVWGDGYADGHMVYDMYECPNCGTVYEIDCEKYEYCPNCGQHMLLEWSDEE